MLTQLGSSELQSFALMLTQLPCAYKLVFYWYNFVHLVKMQAWLIN
jgi:hypothetical protein